MVKPEQPITRPPSSKHLECKKLLVAVSHSLSVFLLPSSFIYVSVPSQQYLVYFGLQELSGEAVNLCDCNKHTATLMIY